MMKNVFYKIIRLLFRCLPTQKLIIFESSPDFSDNAEAFYRYLIEKKVNERYKIVWLFNKETSRMNQQEKNVSYLYRYSTHIIERIKVIYTLLCATYIFDSNVVVGLQRKDQIRIHLGHGMPIKAPREYCEHAGQMTSILVTSDFFKDIYCDLFKVQPSQVLNLGYPRNDYLLKDYTQQKENLFGNQKVIFWMPTYRQHKNGNMNVRMAKQLDIGLPCIHNKDELNLLEKIAEENNCCILFRIHPAQDQSFLNISENSRLININDDYLRQHQLMLYEVLSMSDALITDYSSVYYDFLLTSRPIGLTIPDLEEYSTTFELALDYKENIRGDYIYTFNDLCQFIQNTHSELLEVKKQFHDDDGSSCEKLYQYLKETYKF